MNDSSQSLRSLEKHQRIGRIIRTRSTNRKDIREFALKGTNLSKVRNILDIGAGYGFFVMGLKDRIGENAHIVGIDVQKCYQKPFLEAVRSVGAHGEFHVSDAVEIATYPPMSFDLILSSFSIYFCANALKYVPHILTNDGIFILITHSCHTHRELIPFLKETYRHFSVKMRGQTHLENLLHLLSMENGKKQLSSYFKKIRVKKYFNTLEFRSSNIDEFKFYLQTKRDLILKEAFLSCPELVDDMINHLVGLLKKEIGKNGKMVLNKDDAVFICSGPKTRARATSILSEKKFCIYCGAKLSERTIEGKKRKFCVSCGHIIYENPLPVVSAVVVNRKKGVLLVKRANQPMKGMWCLPAGFAESNENINEAALRELREETGIRGRIKQVLLVETARNFFYGNLIMVAYEVEFSGGKIKAGDDAAEVRFFPLSKIPTLAFLSHEHAIAKYKEQHQL